MCDEREQLIGYIYGESDADERARVEVHLAECETCRAEIAALGRVRDDLLAWEMPRHEPIWRPVVPVQAVPAWRQVPMWALAAAASLLLAAGAAGGIATRMWMPAAAPVTSVAATAAPQTTTVAVTADDLTRLETTILERVRSEMANQLQTVASTAAPPSQFVHASTGSQRDMERIAERLSAVERLVDAQIELNNVFNGKFGTLNSRTANLSNLVQMSQLQPVGFETGGR